MSLVWVALTFAVTAAATAFGFRAEYAGAPTFAVAILGSSATLAVFALIHAHRNGELREWLTLRSGDISIGAVLAALLFGLAFVTTRMMAPVGTPRSAWTLRLYLQLGSPDVLREKAFWVAAAIVLFAIADALVWRGLVPSLLAERVGSRTAWIWGGGLYAAAYVPAAIMLRDPVSGPSWLLVSMALGIGWALGAATRMTGRLLPGIVAHALFAWFSLMTYRLTIPSI